MIEQNTSATHFRHRKLLLGLILLAGFGLRLFRLGAESLWYDETVSTYLAGSPLTDLIRHTAGDIHPPGYYLLLRGWLVLAGYGTGRADPSGNGLEFASAFFSLFFGLLLIALVYVLAGRFAGKTAALVAAALVALSPFNVWYSQEVRMYTVGAVLAAVVLGALIGIVCRSGISRQPPVRLSLRSLYVLYAVAAAAGMYVLYYFAFLLLPLNVWALASLIRQRRSIPPLLLANAGAVVLYAPWIPIAWRQATQPPVPPWRTASGAWGAFREAWTALSFGQSMPAWLWPALLLTLGLFGLGLLFVVRRPVHHGNPVSESRFIAGGLAVAALGPLVLILLVSLVTPLYHVRYLFTYSPPFYVLLAAGFVALARRSRPLALSAGVVWLLAAGVTLQAFWFDPAYRADDHRAAVRELRARWRPGDVVLVNAGWPYTALTTYWDGETGGRYRITGALPESRPDDALVMVTTGHTDSSPSLGWGDPRSDFFAMPSQVAKEQMADLFTRFARVWHYRIYDTVNDPDGLIRALLPRHGQLVDERTYAGEAFMRVEAYAPVNGAPWPEARPGANYSGGLEIRWETLPTSVWAGQTLYPAVSWRASEPQAAPLGASLRLVGPDGQTWVQPPDERPLGPLFTSDRWPPGVSQAQTLALRVPEGTPPGDYSLVLVNYATDTGQPLLPTPVNGAVAAPPGVLLETVRVDRPPSPPGLQPALAVFGPLALLEAVTPVTSIAPGGEIPVELLWQAQTAPGEPLVVVLQLLARGGSVEAALEAQPLGGLYPTQEWQAGELVRDRHTLVLPPSIEPGEYRLIAGVYGAAGGERYITRTGLLTSGPSWTIKDIAVR